MRNPLCAIRYLSEKLPINFPDLINIELRELHSKISKPLKVLDLGAGPGRYWKSTKLVEFFISTGSELVLFDASTQFDGEKFPEGMTVSRRLGLLPKDLNSIQDDEFHVVVAIDLIEHLTKDSGYHLLYEVDRIASKTSILLTPNGFTWQPPSVNNPFNAHISGWSPKEIAKIGWDRQRGQIGFKPVYGSYGLSKYKKDNWVILEILALLKIVAFISSKYSFSFIAIKRKKNGRIENHI